MLTAIRYLQVMVNMTKLVELEKCAGASTCRVVFDEWLIDQIDIIVNHFNETATH